MSAPVSVSSEIESAMERNLTRLSERQSRLPLHVKVQKGICQWILEGNYKAGDKLLTDQQIMEEFKVGRMTARAAIKTLVENNMVTRRPGCGTFLTDPKEWTQPSQAQATQRKILLAYQDMTKEHAGSDDMHMLAAIHEALKNNGAEVSLLSLPENGEQAYRMLSDHLERYNPNGVVMHAICDARLYELVEKLPAITSNFDLFSHIPTVFADFREVVEIAIGHLTSLGHTRIGLITESRHTVHLATSWAFAFERKMADLGHGVPRELICMPRSASELESAVQNLLRADTSPTAILAVGPDAAEFIYRFAEAQGLEVPRDLSVFAYGHACEYIPFAPPLTYVTYDLQDYGKCHAASLFQQFAGRVADRKVRQVHVRLVTGESTAALSKT